LVNHFLFPVRACGRLWHFQLFEALVPRGEVDLAFTLVQHVRIGDGFSRLKELVLSFVPKISMTGALRRSLVSLVSHSDADPSFLSAVVELTGMDRAVESVARSIRDGGLQQRFIKERIFGARDSALISHLVWAFAGPGVPAYLLDKFRRDNTFLACRIMMHCANTDFLFDGFLAHCFEADLFQHNNEHASYFLIALASLSFPRFFERLVPQFLELEPTDPRFVVLLSTIPWLNALKLGRIDEVNVKLKAKICSSRAVFLLSMGAHNAVSPVIESELIPIIEDRTRSVALFLEFTKIVSVQKKSVEFRSANLLWDRYGLELVIIEALPRIFPVRELSRHLPICLNFISHPVSPISEAAFPICISIAAHSPEAFVAELVSSFTKCASEEQMCNLTTLLKRVANSSITFSQSNLALLEFCAVIALAFVYLGTRLAGLSVLEQMAQKMSGPSVMKFIQRYRREIEQSVKRRVLQLVISPSVPAKGIVPPGELSIDSICSSWFYELWLIVLSEFFNVLIALNAVGLRSLIHKHFAGDTTWPHAFLYVSTLYSVEAWSDANHIYKPEVREHADDLLVPFRFFNGLIADNRSGFLFWAIPGIHFSLFPLLLELLPEVGPSHHPDASASFRCC
jgi:hypothetical protein